MKKVMGYPEALDYYVIVMSRSTRFDSNISGYVTCSS